MKKKIGYFIIAFVIILIITFMYLNDGAKSAIYLSIAIIMMIVLIYGLYLAFDDSPEYVLKSRYDFVVSDRDNLLKKVELLEAKILKNKDDLKKSTYIQLSEQMRLIGDELKRRELLMKIKRI